MAKTIDTVLLENLLQEFCEPLYSRLLPPLEISEIYSYFDKWQIEDANLIELFLWKNGIPYGGQMPTYCFDYTGFGVIPPLAYIDQILQLQVSDQRKKSFFPLITSFGGDFLLYETDKNSSQYGQILLFSPNLGYVDFQIGYFDSLNTMIHTLNLLFTSKIFIYDYKNMSLEIIDYKLRSEIAKSLNPKSEYWSEG